jgi:predicted RNase H-like HicB family nuclease
MLRQVKIVVERHADGYVAYPLGVQGAVVGQGDTADEAISEARSALAFHVETFGSDVLDADAPVEAFVVQESVSVE